MREQEAELAAAVRAWRRARASYEDARRSGGEGAPVEEAGRLEGAREALVAAQAGLRAAAARVVARLDALRVALAGLLPEVEAMAAALTEVEEQGALEAEREARHGELAGAGQRQEERVAELRSLAEEAAAALASLEAAVALGP